MEAVADDAGSCIPPRDRQQFRHMRHCMMKGRVKAGDVRNAGKAAHGCRNQRQLVRQMLGIQRTQFAQCRKSRRLEKLRTHEIRAAVDDAVADGDQRAPDDLTCGSRKY